MATDPSFIEHVIDLCDLEGRLVARKMFGEYGFHLDGKFIALACDNSFFVKATASLENHGLNLPLRPPYDGAKPYPVADELLDNPELLRQFMLDTAALLPEPKAKKTRKR
jgi:TfoX/Sxy family transcriptional regulator of competence genes